MSKIVLDVKDRSYTLEINRESAQMMEQLGLTITEEFLSKPITALELLFFGALQMHHPHVNRNLSRKILEGVEEIYDTSNLAKMLIGFYSEAVSPNVDETVEKKTIQVLEG